MSAPNIGCFKDFGSKSDCTTCKVRRSCEVAYNKIVKRTNDWDYKKYREVLDKKFKLENDNVGLFREQLMLKSAVLSASHKIEKNNNLIFKYNNEARKQLGYGIVAAASEIEKEIEVGVR